MDDEERLEGEEEMDLDEASDGEDEDEETSGIPVSPANSDQLLGSTPTPVTPEEGFPDPLRYQKFPLTGGKPLNIRRGPGRPRKERPLGMTRGGGTRKSFGRGSARGKGLGYARGVPRRTKSKDEDTHSESPSPLRTGDDATPDGESNAERSMPAPEEPPYFPEQWPGKVCALCNLGERSQLGQGELLRLSCPPGFTPEKSANRDETTVAETHHLADVAAAGDKSPRAATAGPGAVTCRRQKSLAKCRNTSLTNFSEPVEELTIVGYSEEPELGALFETTGHYYVHQSCVIWSSNSQEVAPELTSRAVVSASSRRCAYCSHYGAGIPCKVASCNRYFHFPCAAASSCFQDTKSLSLFCGQHLGQVPLLLNGDVTCVQCYGMGDVSNLVMCSICGQHYHGGCVGLALLPGVRAGWQCVTCRVCQVCRQPEDVSKVMLCERCDKAYHPGCLRPIVTSIPKYGWKCKCCRVCTDCGSRTPGAGLSSRWHSHYTVCDSCYQQRNKGFSCPLCRKAYRAAAYREMVQCNVCKKFVHGTCDSEADPAVYQQRKEAKPDYEYVCLHCKKSVAAYVRRKDSMDECGGTTINSADQSISQDNLFYGGAPRSPRSESSELDCQSGGADEALYSVGLGKGKPYYANKIAKKRLGLGLGLGSGGGCVGRPKGVGKLGYQKRQKMTEFGRKRGPKAKMRGIFGAPGVGLQRPTPDSSSKEDEPGVENRLVLCSAKDKFVLTQDICVMCGAIGTDQEGCLIACAQCGQCYHPYCANVKVTKVILQKGWRCLDCTVCEGCGERNDEARLILCDDCDISYHIYCMDPPLEYVPHGNWKCKWCAQCQTCGSNDPGFNSSWQKSYTQCGPCASHSACVACQDAYQEGDLIIQCVQCERWLHCGCDSIKSEVEAERCAEEGYICLLCRPRDVPPPHLLCAQPKLQPKYTRSSPPPATQSPELFKPSTQPHLVDGVYLSDIGMNHIKSLTSEHQQTRKKRRKLLPLVDKEADIMATIESVVAGGSLDNSLEGESGKLELVDVKDEPAEVKEGTVWPVDQPPPEGFSVCTSEAGIPVLRRKRQRNLQKLGIGGFNARFRTRKDKEEEGVDLEKQGEAWILILRSGEPEKPGGPVLESSIVGVGDDKPRRKPQRRKPKPKLAECFPLYMQEAFFGKDLMDTTKDKDLESSSESEGEHNVAGNADTIQLSQDELKAMEQVKAKQEKEDDQKIIVSEQIKREEIMEDEGSDTEALGDILPISGDLLDSDLVNTIMNEPDEDLAKASEALDELDDAQAPSKDELTDILSPHFNLESMVRDTGLPNMDSKDIEEIFKGVLTDESQESQESSVFSVQAQASHPSSSTTPLVSPSPHPSIPAAMPLVRPQVPGTLSSVGQSSLNSPMSFPPPSPYHSEYSNSPQFSPAFSEPPSPWVNPEDEGNAPASNATISYNQRTNQKMETDEALGVNATISSVLYANINHPEWKTEYPAWSERCKQILKKWRALSNDKKTPYLTQARDNRAASRMKKTQQEQDRLSNREGRSTREAEQERQWKHMQAIRQQQAQMQQQVIHEQRVHAIARVQRQITEDSTPQLATDTNSGVTTQLQVSTAQDTNQLTPLASPSPGSRSTFATPPLKVTRSNLTPQSPHQGMVRLPNQVCPISRTPGVVRPGFPQPPSPFSPQAPQSPHDFPQSPASSQAPEQQQQQQHFQQRFEGSSDGFSPRGPAPTSSSYSTSSPQHTTAPAPPSTTPRAVFNPPAPSTRPAPVYAPPPPPPPPPAPPSSRTPDPYNVAGVQPPPTTPVSAAPAGYPSPRAPEPPRAPGQEQEVFSQQPEVNRQLRDLLQRQQFSKKIEGVGTSWTQDGQNNSESGQQQFETSHVQLPQHPQMPGNSGNEGTFRQPLPPSIVRARMPIQPNVLIRNPIAGNIDARLQGIDHRTRMLQSLQRPQTSAGLPQHFQSAQTLQTRLPAARNTISEPYDILHQQRFADANQTQGLNQRIIRTAQDSLSQGIRMLGAQNIVRTPLPTTIGETTTSEASSEIPDNVTAELEKLEQEGGASPMVEVAEGVNAIFGDLADDDDELLAEMGADFNILEYADPELDTIAGGEKTNILDLDLEQVEVEPKEEKQKKETKDEEQKPDHLSTGPAEIADSCSTSTTLTTLTEGTNVPSMTSSQPASQPNPTAIQAQVVQQQMHQHVQQAAAMGRPMLPGTRLLSPDGAVGVVTSTNTVTVSYPSSFPGHPQRISPAHIQVSQQQRLGMRVPGVPNVAGRVVAVNHIIGPRMPLAPPPPPPPPPYPGPPPPYPGPIQMGLCLGGGGGRAMTRPPPVVHMGHQQVPVAAAGPPMCPAVHTGAPPHPHRRPLLLQEQPLLLEELLEQEKREQEKQQQQQQQQQQTENATSSSGGLLSDSDFERLRADVLGASSPPQPMVPAASVPVIRPPCTTRPPSVPGTGWQQTGVPDSAKLATAQVPRQPIATQTPPESRLNTFNIPLIPAPPTPPEIILNEQDRQAHMQYDHWLVNQQNVLTQQLKFYESEIQKIRKMKKSLTSKQRQLRKTGNDLSETDSAELTRVSTEQTFMQKHLEQSRKQLRQHNLLAQEYHNKQQQRQPSTSQVPQSNNPEPCSPLMSPSQHSPMHSPAALVSQSPGASIIQHSPATPSIVQHSPGATLLQHSPGNPQSTNPGTMSPHNVQQQSPRIGTPHSQGGEDSPFSPQSGALPSPGGLCGPAVAVARMTSPQHRALISGRLAAASGSPVAFTVADAVRVQQPQQRFARPASGGGGTMVMSETAGQQRVPPRAVAGGMPVYGQRSPLGSPQPTTQQASLLGQQPQLLQRQQLIQQQHDVISQDGQNVVTQRTLQMAQQRQQMLQQQQQQHDVISQDGTSSITQRSLQMVQQRQQLLQQQQHEAISQDGPNVVTQRTLQMVQQRQQMLQQQQQQHENISQDGQNVVTQRTLQMVQQRQQIHQQQHESISQAISQDGQNVVTQRTLQMVQQRQQMLQQQQQQQHENLSQDGQNVVTQRTLQMVQQRQQMLQQQQHEGISQVVSQEGQNAINQRTLQIAQRQQILQQQQQQQQRQQYLQMQQQQKPPSSPMVSQPANSPSPQLLQQGYGQPPSSPMVQQTTMGSPMLQQSLNPTSQPPSPMNRISPMVSQYQPPSPMSRSHPSTSPMLHGGHHPSSTANQPPSSPMMPRSPLIAGSPMQMQRRQSTGNSPAMPDRPQSVENPPTPRTPHTPHSFVQGTNLAASSDQQQILQQVSQEQISSSEHVARNGNPHNPLNPVPSPNPTRGGGNPNNSLNPISSSNSVRAGGNPNNPLNPIPSVSSTKGGGNTRNPLNPIPFPNFGRFGFFKLGLRGGSPMWSSKAAESNKSCSTGTGSDTSQEEKPNTSVLRKTTKIGSLVCADYNDFDDDSHTPPQTPPTGLDTKQGSQSSSLTSSTLDNGPLDSPGEKLDQLADTTDYDDDKTIVTSEVTLSSAAQRDSDDITVIEQFGDSELVDVISGSLEGDIQEEYVLFEPGMVVDLSADSNDSLCHALVNADGGQGDLVQILEIENPESQSEEPILSDDDLVPSNTRNKKGLRLDIVRTLQAGKKLVAVTDTSESPDQEELRVDPSPGPYLDNSPDQDLMVSLVSESEVVIIDPTTKSPEDNLSKGSCDEDTEKTDVNLLTDVSKDSTTIESLIDDQTKSSQKDSKQGKSLTSFVFPEKGSYNQTMPSTIHQTNISAATTSRSPVSSATTTISSILNTKLVSSSHTSSHSQILAQTIATEANTTNQDILLNSFSDQKGINLPSTMASIVADAKLAARLSQTALENTSNSQQGKLDPKISETLKMSSLTTTSSVQNEFPCSTSIETLNNSTKLILNIQSTSLTLSTPKMTDLSKKESTLKMMERQAESQEGEMKKKTEEEEFVQTRVKDQSISSAILSTSLTEEKMSDPLNTTDELESMLEAIHNPAEATLKDENKNESATTATLKRMSPVADDLSLVNILENDVEPVDNDKEENSSSSETQKIMSKAKEVEGNLEESNSTKNMSPKEKIAEELELENAKPYLQHCLSEEKTLMEESSDDILDMLHNIISSKPEMANTSELKSSLIYQMPSPLDTLPLNILQDPLMDLDQESLENDQLPTQESKSQVKNLNSEAKKSPPAPNQAVVQLQKSTTTVPHLSPLSKPTELTSNVANVSHQLRTLLSSLQSNQTTGNQTGVVTMVSSVKPASVLSTTNTLSTSNSSTSNVSLSRLDQSRSQASVNTSVVKEAELTLKESSKESTGITSAISKADQIFRVTTTVPTTSLQSSNSSNLTSTISSSIMTTRTITTSISITSNALLNAMLSETSSIKSVAPATIPPGHGRTSNTVPTQSGNPLSSALPSTSIPRSQPTNLQATLQVSSVASRALMNTSSTVTSSIQCVRTIVPPLATSSSILQSTLSQAPSHLLTSNHSQHKSPLLLPIDNKNNDLENQSTTMKRDTEDSKVPEKTSGREIDLNKSSTNPMRYEESQNVLLKQLLQSNACVTPTSTSTTQGQGQGQGSTGLSLPIPTLPIVNSLAAQLDQPVVPTQPTLLPHLLNETPVPKAAIGKQVLARETSFLSSHSVTPIKIQSSPKEETPKPPPPLSMTTSLTTQRGQIDTLKQQQQQQANQMIKLALPSSSGSLTGHQQQPPVAAAASLSTTMAMTMTTMKTSPKSCEPEIGCALVKESLPAQQRMAIPVSRVPSTQQKPPVASKSIPLPASNASSLSVSQTPGPQPPSTLQVTQKSVVSQQQTSSASSSSPNVTIKQQPIQQVPHSLPHGHVSISSPATAVAPSGPAAATPLVEVKKEAGLDEVILPAQAAPTSASHLHTDTKDFLASTKEELMDGTMDDKTDLKKLKRRQYQQKRKQSQGKDTATAPQKKRSRKVSRLDEDYDTFVDNVMAQLRQLQPMAVLEPLLGRNYGVCPIYGCGDLAKIASQRDYNARVGDLTGSYGSANLSGLSDHYNTQPFGELDPLPPQQPPSTQRGFYDQEFPPLKLDDSDDKKENIATNRDVDSPDTIVSSSSPECVIPEFMHRFPGLRLIEEESDEEADWLKRVSPVIPLISPIPIRLKPAYAKDVAQQDKENLGVPKLGKSPPIPLRESGNVTVTLTLNSQAADDIMGVLKDLANILNIAPPTGYQIVERTTTPPSQKLGLYRIKGKDGKEGAPIDIQSILNGAAKFCRHCDVVILNSLIRKKVSDLPFLSKEEAEPGDELCFCSAACYMQFALMHRTPSNTQDKAATIVDHLCHKTETKILDDDLKSLKKIPIKQQQLQQTVDQRVESMEIDNETTMTTATDVIKVKIEKPDHMENTMENMDTEEKRPKKHSVPEESSETAVEPQPPAKVWRGLKYKTWSMGVIQPTTKFKKTTDREITEMLFRMGVTVVPAKAEDSRRCMFCQSQGDGTADGPARLLNFDVDKWVHLNCALWAEDVYETVNGALINLDTALQHSLVLNCIICEKPGATVKCFKTRCTNVYHLGCAVKDGCVFYKNKSTFCSQHVQKNEKDNELTTLSVYRRVYVNRDENRQVAAVMHHSEHNHLLRVGSLIFLSVGQLLPHQLQNFHTANYIYPVGYKIVRFYWSMRRPNKRCRYVCSIHDVSGRPEFRVLVQEPLQEDVELRDATPRAVWSRILEPLAELRRNTNSVQLFPRYVSGEDLFGLTEPAVVRVLESLPGIETLTDYRFKYGRNPLLELPLAINPTGSARTEARLRNQLPWKRPHTQRTGSHSSARAAAATAFAPSSSSAAAAAFAAGEVACPYSKQFVHSKSSQYKKMKQEWRNNVYLARSKIQGLGLYAARDLEKHTMVIEYIGEIIRTELAETREKQYEARNRGIYMFRLDEERVVDATLCGGLARYINHSCNPNCVAEIVEVERDLRIIIFAKRRISRGEELAYDYKFDIEDDQHKIACACGAPNCRKWMN